MVERYLGDDEKGCGIRVLRSELLEKEDGVEHFITLRNASDATDPWDGISLCHYVGDSPERVAAARQRVAEALGIGSERILMPRQVHGTAIAVDRDDCEADAIVSTRRGYCVGVSTADCVPVLLYARVPGVVAAVHAGWRGVVAGIVPETVLMLVREFGCRAEDMVAVIGPCIHVGAFEVGEEVAQRFEERFVRRDLPPVNGADGGARKPHADLPGAVEAQLRECGVREIDNSAPCTFENADVLFSARRHSVRSGRIASCIMLR